MIFDLQSSPASSAPPTNISISDVTNSSITVQWGPVICVHRNGDITGYSVQYGVQGSGSTQNVSISGGAIFEATISELEHGTSYAVKLAATTSAGIGVYSDTVSSLTSGEG